ncbi:submandibular gland protein C-like [Mastomys coucha]|uniref:submandibular gland protein C-like n=1 Tax=Mastomys coucha TaxID=35658 RepID=UPI001261B39B|nr:submandibular gland protein C-like [Mastomys coucha]
MKLILLYLAVVLCTVCKARIFRHTAGIHASTSAGLRLSESDKTSLNAKSSSGSKDNLSDGGKKKMRSGLNLKIGGSAGLQSNLEASGARPPGASGVHGHIRLGTEISRRGGSVSGTTTGSSRPNGSSSNRLSTVQDEEVAASGSHNQNVESSISSAGSASSSAGTTTESSRPNGNPSNRLSMESDDPTVQDEEVAASVSHKQNAESDSPSASSAASNTGVSSVVQPSEKGLKKLIKTLADEFGKIRPDASVSGTTTGSSRPNENPSNRLSMESDDPTVLEKDLAASGSQKHNVESGSSPPSSAASSAGGDFNEVSGPSSSALVSTDSGANGNLVDKQGPGVNGHEGEVESLDTASKSDSGSHNVSSGSGSSLRSNISADVESSDQSETAGLGGSGKVTCPTGKTLSGSPFVA